MTSPILKAIAVFLLSAWCSLGGQSLSAQSVNRAVAELGANFVSGKMAGAGYVETRDHERLRPVKLLRVVLAQERKRT